MQENLKERWTAGTDGVSKVGERPENKHDGDDDYDDIMKINILL